MPRKRQRRHTRDRVRRAFRHVGQRRTITREQERQRRAKLQAVRLI